jgi:hypothetical protein
MYTRHTTESAGNVASKIILGSNRFKHDTKYEGLLEGQSTATANFLAFCNAIPGLNCLVQGQRAPPEWEIAPDNNP